MLVYIYSALAGLGSYIRISKPRAISAFIDDAFTEALPCNGLAAQGFSFGTKWDVAS